jgi:hypothetical protein
MDADESRRRIEVPPEAHEPACLQPEATAPRQVNGVAADAADASRPGGALSRRRWAFCRVLCPLYAELYGRRLPCSD